MLLSARLCLHYVWAMYCVSSLVVMVDFVVGWVISLL
jgi:hypothetical protein